jgi:ribosomal protection tetracycline resistance protein
MMRAGRVQDLQRQLPGLTGGEGVIETKFAGYQPVSGAPPVRRRTMANPLNRDEYMMELARWASRPKRQRRETGD